MRKTLSGFLDSERGAVPILILAVVLGIVGYSLFTSVAPFKEGLLSSFYPKSDSEAATLTSCWPSGTPIGALSGQPSPTWCYTDLTTNVPDTHNASTNSWLDDFEHGVSFGEFKDGQGGYRVFDKQGGVNKSQHWRHGNHWMVDIAPKSQSTPADWTILGGTMMRPDQSFRFENGKLVVEADVAAGIEAYGCQACIWPELVVTNAPSPTSAVLDELYTYGQFGGYWSFGCRLGGGTSRTTTCALYAPTKQNFSGNNYFGTDGGRVFEMSFFQQVGAQTYDAQFDPQYKDYWRICASVDADTNCRDRFRMELTKTSVTLYVNGAKYFEQKNMPSNIQFPDEFINNPVYFYGGSWLAVQTSDAVRFHWDRMAVNPKDLAGNLLPPSGVPCLSGMVVTYPGQCPNGSPTPAPTLVPTPTAIPSPTPSPTPKPLTSPSSNPTATPNPTISPTPQPTPAPITGNYSLQFFGNSFIQIPNSSSLNTIGDWTAEAWFKDESTDSYTGGSNYNHPLRYILLKGDTDTNSESPYLISVGFNKLYAGSRTAWGNKQISYDLAKAKVGFGGWHHVAVTFQALNRQVTIYLDGRKVTQGNLSNYSRKGNSESLFIGANNDQAGWVGKIDDVRIWNVVRSATLIRSSYEMEFTGKQSGLVGNWRFDEGTGGNTFDLVSALSAPLLNLGWSTDVYQSGH